MAFNRVVIPVYGHMLSTTSKTKRGRMRCLPRSSASVAVRTWGRIGGVPVVIELTATSAGKSALIPSRICCQRVCILLDQKSGKTRAALAPLELRSAHHTALAARSLPSTKMVYTSLTPSAGSAHANRAVKR